MKFVLFSLLAFTTFLLSSCFVRTNQVRFKTEVPLASEHSYFKRDSVKCVVTVEPETRNFVMPLFIFLTNKKKSRITYCLYGKGQTGREYENRFIHLEIKNGDVVVGRSRDSLLFNEKKEAQNMIGAVTPFYATTYLMRMVKPKEVNLHLEMEFDAVAKDGTRIPVKFSQPMEKIRTKDISLFRLHIFKK
ncbi:MAG: hypothetical protein ACXVPN_00810 [Bacteroidia bacterium]